MTTLAGRYLLGPRFASGGMASVHLGRMVGPVGFSKRVAIKRLHAHVANDPDFTLMLLDEARVVARIDHPNVVSTLDVVCEEGEVFVVMEYVHGESLATLLRRATPELRPSLNVLVSIFASALQGLHAAHEARGEDGRPLGVVHRDVSPQNLLVGLDGLARVLDFGIAKSLTRTQNTRDGQIKGKLGYIAPEQIKGEATPRTDVYSASLSLYEALTGQRPYRGDNDAEVIYSVLEGGAPPPSEVGTFSDARLDEIVLRGLARDPSQRFPSACAMAEALEAAVPPATARQVGEWVASIAGESLHERLTRDSGEPSRESSDDQVTATALGDETSLSAVGPRLGERGVPAKYALLAVLLVAAASVYLAQRWGQSPAKASATVGPASAARPATSYAAAAPRSPPAASAKAKAAPASSKPPAPASQRRPTAPAASASVAPPSASTPRPQNPRDIYTRY